MADTFIYVMEGANASDEADRAAAQAAAAAASAAAAGISETNAGSDALAAAGSASTASSKATEASGYADAASGSADSAEQSANTADSRANAAALSVAAAAGSATEAAGYANNSAASAVQSLLQAERASSFVGGNWPLPHSHVTGPRIIDPDFSRASAAYDSALRRWEYNERRWGENGTLVEEGTTNLLPTGAENFVTGWSNGTGETCTVVDYPINIPGVGDVIAKRITGNGAGSSGAKYYYVIGGRTNPHTEACSAWCMLLSGNAVLAQAGGLYPATITSTMQRLITVGSMSTTETVLSFRTAATSDVLDIVVYAPQMENKPYATTYTPPGTTRAADTFALPINAYQKNLLTANQATGGDTLGDTTGFISQNSATISRDTTEKWNGTGSLKVVTPNSVGGEGFFAPATGLSIGKIYVFSLCAKGTGTCVVRKYGPAVVDSSPVTLSSTFTKYSVIFTADSTGTAYFGLLTSGVQAATFYIDGLQLEEGTTASDFALPAVDYSNALINPTAGTIEMDFVFPSVNGVPHALFDTSNVNNNRLVAYIYTTGQIYLMVGTGATFELLGSGITGVAGTKYRIAVAYDSNRAALWVNGVKKVNSSNAPALVFLSSIALGRYAVVDTAYLNSHISNLRISNIARTDTEMAYTGQLTPDQYTTYFSPMKETISSRPYCKDSQGNAQSVVLAGDRPNQNAIINGDFRLASRGTSFTNPATASYPLDGAQIAYNGTGAAFTITQEAATVGQRDVPGAVNFMRVAQTVAPTGQTQFYYRWKIEDVKMYSGEKCRIVLNLRSPQQVVLPYLEIAQYFGSGGSSAATAMTALSIKTYSKITKYAFGFTMPSVAGKTIGAGNAIYVALGLPINVAFTLDLADIELKPADAPDSYYRRDLQMLQQLGNRTLQKLPANLQLRAINVQANYIDFESVMLPTEMRAVPALSGTYAETTNWKVLVNGTQTTGFSLALLNASANQVAFRATKTAHGLTDATLQLVTNVLLSAEL